MHKGASLSYGSFADNLSHNIRSDSSLKALGVVTAEKVGNTNKL